MAEKIKFKVSIKELSFEYEGAREVGQALQAGLSRSLAGLVDTQRTVMLPAPAIHDQANGNGDRPGMETAEESGGEGGAVRTGDQDPLAPGPLRRQPRRDAAGFPRQLSVREGPLRLLAGRQEVERETAGLGRGAAPQRVDHGAGAGAEGQGTPRKPVCSRFLIPCPSLVAIPSIPRVSASPPRSGRDTGAPDTSAAREPPC